MDGMEQNQQPESSLEEKVDALCQVVEILIDKVEAIEEKASRVESMVIDDLFGGIERLYNDNQRKTGIEDLRGKYGDIFAPHMDGIKALEPDTDIFEKLHDILGEMKGQDGYTDEMGDSRIRELANEIGDMIAKVKGEMKPAGGDEVVAEGEPGGGAVEVTKVETKGGADPDLMARVREMREQATSRRLKGK